MKILVFLPCLTNGGAERQGLFLARALREQGMDVQVWAFPSPSGKNPLNAELSKAGIRSFVFPEWPSLDWAFSKYQWGGRRVKMQFFEWPKSLKSLCSRLPDSNFDVVVPFTFWPCITSVICKSTLKAKKVLWNHRGGYDAAGIEYTPFLKKIIQKNKPVLVANSSVGAEFLKDTISEGRMSVSVIPNAYCPDEDAREYHRKKGGGDTLTVRLLHVANFFPEKDWSTLLEAMGMLSRSETKYVLHLVGYFPQSSDEKLFYQKIADLGLEDSVVVHGSLGRKEVIDQLLLADIGLLSSRSEGMSNSVMEYMYFGLPVVATDIPGNRELLGRDNHDWLFGIGDADGMRTFVEELGKNPPLRDRVGQQNRNRLLSKFSQDTVLVKWQEILFAGQHAIGQSSVRPGACRETG